jgi:hypothetical protein
MDVTEYESWALQDNFPAITAAALWCGKNPYYCGSWDNALFNQISFIAINIVKQQLIAENYPEYKRNVVILELCAKSAQRSCEFFEIIGKFILSREQLKAIAEKSGVKPVFLFGTRVETGTISNNSDLVDPNSDDKTKILINDSPLLPGQNRDIDKWLFDTWLENCKPGGAQFFTILKRYKGKKGSPILEHFSSGSEPGLKWKTANAEGELSKKRIQNMVGETFKKIPVKS